MSKEGDTGLTNAHQILTLRGGESKCMIEAAGADIASSGVSTSMVVVPGTGIATGRLTALVNMLGSGIGASTIFDT